ncbi:hypothetical protein [Oceanicella sp. SM1341]|uniref:hypothetical protein n=1 Tax=Oceanicella sp. SM1341 TaxID=1548889 RepID=UPI000E52DF20|nr:hypothetical protein [Oceanicella sp. SM1341]
MEFDIAYMAVVGAGALTLIVEALRQFSVPVNVHPHERYPILQGVELDTLCTKAELIRGLMFYVLIYLLIYAALLGSAELYALVQAGEGRVKGPTGDIPGGSDGLLGAGAYGKPFYVSAAIIAALSTGFFAPVERCIRSVAHRLADIPYGVYRVITRLHRVDYARIGTGYHLPLTEAYARIAPAAGDGSTRDALLADTVAALKTIDLVGPAVVGEYRDQLFAQTPVAALDSLLERVRGDVDGVTAALGTLSDAPDALQSFQQSVLRTRNNLLAVFALLFIRNDRSVAGAGGQNPTSEVIRAIESERDPALQSLAGAVMASGLLTVLSTWGIYSAWASGAHQAGWFAAVMREGLWLGFATVLSFAACAGLALMVRESREERNRWKPWRLSRMPFLRFLGASLLPALAAVAACVVAGALEDLVAAGTLTSAQLRDFLRDYGGFCALSFAFGIIIAFHVFLVVDLHERLPHLATLGIALVMAGIYALWALVVVASTYGTAQGLSWQLREAALLGAPALIFFLAFAALMEWSED